MNWNITPSTKVHNLKLSVTIVRFVTLRAILGCIFTTVSINCPAERHEKLICGRNNDRLKHITELATSDLIETFQKPVSLTITVRSKKKEE